MPQREHRFRRAVLSDARAVSELVDAAYRPYIERIGITPGPMTEDYREVIRTRQVTVAQRGRAIEGVVVTSAEDAFVTENVAVHPSARGQGVGRALLELAESKARRAGFDSIHLYTHEKMVANLSWYSRHGYIEYERRSQGDFALVFMRKRLA